MTDEILQFHDVEFAHAGGPPIVRGLSFTCRSGETVTLVGRSGAGKSTLLRLANRLFLPTRGEVVVEGRTTGEWDPIRLRRRIGYVMQDAGLFPHMTVEENVGIVPVLEGWRPERIKARSLELLEMVGLPAGTYAPRRPAELSGGQRQRVGLARALAAGPDILLMDEPFGALDPITRAEMRREFARIEGQVRTTALFVTHDIAEAFALGDRVGVMDAGELIAIDTPDALNRSGDARVRALIDSATPSPVRAR
jgi:osmoprotectant transport system ATP-binding protein